MTVSTDTVSSDSTGTGLKIEVSSAKEISERALSRQSSALSSSLAKAGLERSISCPPREISAFQGARPSSAAILNSDQTQWYNSHALGDAQNPGLSHAAEDEEGDSQSLGTSFSQARSLKVPRQKLRRRHTSEESELAASLDENEGESVRDNPPHLMNMQSGYASQSLDLRSRPGSLYEGVGRKLRGMDAVRFRRQVMRQTGFLESTSESSFENPAC